LRNNLNYVENKSPFRQMDILFIFYKNNFTFETASSRWTFFKNKYLESVGTKQRKNDHIFWTIQNIKIELKSEVILFYFIIFLFDEN